MTVPEAFNDRSINERRLGEALRHGTVTETLPTSIPPKVRVDGNLMPIIVPGAEVGDTVVWFNHPDNPVCFGKMSRSLTGAPKIWVAPTLRGGDTTWRAADGDTRTLSDRAARHTADGGIIGGPNNLTEWYARGDYGLDDDLPTTGKVIIVVDMTTWWSLPAGASKDEYSQPLFADWNGTLSVVPEGWYATGDPSSIAITDGTSSPNANGILLDPSTVGVSGYERLVLKIEKTAATGVTEAWLSTIDDTTTNYVSQGTATFTSSATGSAMEFTQDNTLAASGPYDGWAPYVLHGMMLRYSASGGGNGLLVHGWQINNINYEPRFHTHDVPSPSEFMLGTSVIQDGSGFYQQYDSDVIVSPRGAPLFLPDSPAGNIDNIFSDGGDLEDPIMAVSYASLDPGHIYIVEGQQPHDISGLPGVQSLFIHAVADRATAPQLDENGWPANWWPFGTLM